MVADYLAGASAAGVGRTYRIDTQTAIDHLRRRGIEIRQQHACIPEAEIQTIKELRAAGFSLSAIGKKYGCTRQTISNTLKRQAT